MAHVDQHHRPHRRPAVVPERDVWNGPAVAEAPAQGPASVYSLSTRLWLPPSALEIPDRVGERIDGVGEAVLLVNTPDVDRFGVPDLTVRRRVERESDLLVAVGPR